MAEYFQRILLCFAALIVVLSAGAAVEAPDMKAVDKLFKERRYAEALKGYMACEQARVGGIGYVLLQEIACAEKINDARLRKQALKKLCALDLSPENIRCVEAAYQKRYEELLSARHQPGDMDRYLKELVEKFRGGGLAAHTATAEVRSRLASAEWTAADRLFRNCCAAYPQSLTNAMRFVAENLQKKRAVAKDSLPVFLSLAREDLDFAMFLAEKGSSLPGCWMLFDGVGDDLVKRGKADKALDCYRRASNCANAPANDLGYKVISLELGMPSKRGKAIPHALESLKDNPKSKWHFALFRLVLKALAEEGRFDEAEALAGNRKLVPQSYMTDSVASDINGFRARREKLEEEKRKKALIRRRDEPFENVAKLRDSGKFHEALKACDAICAESCDKDFELRALRLSADICYGDLCDFHEAARRYESLVLDEGLPLGLTLPVRRLLLSFIVVGREREAQDLLDRLPKHDATRENPEYNDIIAGLAAGIGGVRPERLGVAARTMRAANILFEAGETPLALKLFKRVNVKNGAVRGMENEAMMQEARCLGRLGQTGMALSAYRRLMQRVGRSKLASDVLMRMAVLYAGLLGDREKAILCYEQVEAEYPNTPNAEQAMFYRLTMLMMAGEWEDAAKLRIKFLKICKNDSVRRAVDVAYGDAVKRRSLKPKGK